MKKAIVPLGIILLLVFGVFMYINRFTLFHTVEIEGIVFDTTDITSNLAGGLENDENREITYKNIKVNDNIYKSGKKYYIGEETKKNIVIEYPIIASDSSNILILSKNGNFIDERFNKTTTYKNTFVSEGTLYNGVDYSKADDLKYIFVETDKGIFMNLNDIKITQARRTHNIPKHSFIYFEHSFLRYYYQDNGEYRFKEIAAIQDVDKISFNDKEYDYYDFLILMGILEQKADKYEPEPEVEEDEKPESEGNQNGSSSSNNNGGSGQGQPNNSTNSNTNPGSIQLPPPNDYQGGSNIVDKEYVKPEVKVSNLKTGVYTLKGLIDVYDPADRIYKTPTFEFYLEDELYMRSSYSRTTEFVTSGLLPNKEYTVKCYYNYRDERNQKRKGTCLKDTKIKTKDINTLETLKLSYGKVKPDIKSVLINDIKLNNKVDSEVLYGINEAYIKFENGKKIKIPFSQLKELTSGEKINFDSGNTLESGTIYKGIFEFYDIAKNQLKVSGNKIEFTTLKSPPTAELTFVADNKNYTKAKFNVKLSNKDSIKAENYKAIVYETISKEQIRIFSLEKPENNKGFQENTLENLKPETAYTTVIYCDYLNNDGKWIYNYEITSENIYTAELTTLGKVNLNITIDSITSSFANINIIMPDYNIEKPIYQIMENNVLIKISEIDNKTGEVAKVFEIDDYTKVELGHGVKFKFSETGSLKSNTKYKIEVVPYTKMLGGKKYELPTAPTAKEFKTLKENPKIYIANGFLAENYVDFDICIEDIDGAILNENAKVNFVEGETLYNAYTIKTMKSCTSPVTSEEENTENYESYTRITDKTLSDNGSGYRLEVVYPEYRLTDTESVQKNVKIYPLENDAQEIPSSNEKIIPIGTKSDFELLGVINDVNYDLSHGETEKLNNVNLFDITNKSRWIYQGKTNEMTQVIKIDDKTIEFSSKQGYKEFSYYIPELKEKNYTMSFYLESEIPKKPEPNSNSTYNDAFFILFESGEIGAIENKKNISSMSCENTSDNGCFIKINNLTQEGNYIRFYLKLEDETTLRSKPTKITIRDLKIELGNNQSPQYSEFGTSDPNAEQVNTFTGKIKTTIEDLFCQKEGLVPEEFFNENWKYEHYVKFYVDGIENDTIILGEHLGRENANNILEEVVKRNIASNKSIEARMGVSIEYSSGVIKNHDLKIVEFTTEAETRTLRTMSDFQTMHPAGYYIVDLKNSETCKYGNNKTENNCIDWSQFVYFSTFKGNIDFRGQKVLIRNSNYYWIDNIVKNADVFSKISDGAIIKNIDLLYVFDEIDPYNRPYNNDHNAGSKYTTKKLIGTNNGTIQNININFIVPESHKAEIIDLLGQEYFTTGTLQPKYIENFLVTDSEKNIELCSGESISVESNTPIPVNFRDTGLSDFTFVANTNNGIIENFAVKLNQSIPISKNFGTIAINNNGIIRNGYVTGEDIKSGYTNGNSKKNIGVIASNSTSNSEISNVYTYIDISFDVKEYGTSENTCYMYKGKNYKLSQSGTSLTQNEIIGGRIVGSASNSLIKNAISIEKNYSSSKSLKEYDALIPSSTTNNIKNLYYIGEEQFNLTNSKQMPIGTLISVDFMEKTLNEDKMFNVIRSTILGEFPRLQWPSVMPSQNRIRIPENNNIANEKFTITSVISTIQDKKILSKDFENINNINPAKINFEIYNPSGWKVVKIEFDGLEMYNTGGKQKITQTRSADGDGELSVYIRDIKKYQTNYQITYLELSKNGTTIACGIDTNNNANTNAVCADTKAKNYKLDLYLYVNSLAEINDAINKGHNNLKLSQDIKTNKNSDDTYVYLSEPSNGGVLVLDGNGYKIQELYANNCFIQNLTSESVIKNLTIENYHVMKGNGTGDNHVGLVCNAEQGSMIDNVHISNKIDIQPNLSTSSNQTTNSTQSQNYVQTTNSNQTTENIKYFGGLVAYANGLTISNSSISQITANWSATGDDNVCIGGLVGGMEKTSIKNSFVRKISFNISSGAVAEVAAVGGIAGRVSSGNIENVYATGTIDVKSSGGNIGGIVGDNSGNIKSVISKVNIYSITDKLGGVVGNIPDIENKIIMETLALGDVLTQRTEGSYENVDRTSGTHLNNNNNNFAWNRQMINGKIDANSSLEELLTEEDLSTPSVYQTKIGLSNLHFALNQKNTENDEEYDYYIIVEDKNGASYVVKKDSIKVVEREDGTLDEVIYDKQNIEVVVKKKSGTIPKIRNSDTGELLPNQDYEKNYNDVKIEYIEKFSLVEQPNYTYCNNEGCNVEAWDADYVNLTIQLEVKDSEINKNSLSIEISDMHKYDPTSTETSTEIALCDNNNCNIENTNILTVTIPVKADDNKNYDTFNIEKIHYKNNGSDTTTHTYPTKIKMTIPFYGKISSADDWQSIEPGTYQNFSLAGNVDFSDGTTPKVGLSFNKLIGLTPSSCEQKENCKYIISGITIDSNNLITNINSEITNINFDSITISNENTSNSGIIQNLYGKMTEMDFNNITIDTKKASNVGIISNNSATQIVDINMSNINVTGKANVGGFIGNSQKGEKINIEAYNIHISGSGNYVGGIIGKDVISQNRLYVTDVYVYDVDIVNTGNYTGGAFGQGLASNVTVDHGTVNGKGGTYVGGIFGNSNGVVSFNYTHAKDLTVTGGSYVGGISGYSGGNNYARSENNTITGNSLIGGISGTGVYTRYYQYSLGNTITGTGYGVGGITGYNTYPLIYAEVGPLAVQDGINQEPANRDTIIEGNCWVGGIAGYSNLAQINNTINQASITANHSVGGLVGYINYSTKAATTGKPQYTNNVIANSVITAKTPVKVIVPVHGDGKLTDDTSKDGFDTEFKDFYFAGGLIGRFYRNFGIGGISNNVISAEIIIGDENEDSNKYAYELNGVGYVYGGSNFYYKNVSQVKEEYIDELGELKYITRPYYTTYDWSTSYGDEYINKYLYGIHESWTPQTKLYEGSRINRVTFEYLKEGNDKNHYDHYSKYYKNLTTDKGYGLEHIESLKDITIYPNDFKHGEEGELEYFPSPYAKNLTDSTYINLGNMRIDHWPGTRQPSRTPGENAVSQTQEMTTTYSSDFHVLPDFEIYASDVDKINIEFKEPDSKTFFTINGNSYYVNQTTYTFYYDFKQDFEIVISDSINSKTIKVSAEDVKNGVQVLGEYYYKLQDGEVITNQPEIIIDENLNEEDVIDALPDNNEEEITKGTEEGELVAYATSPSVALLSNKKEILKDSTQKKLTSKESTKIVENATNIYGEKILLDNQDIYDISTGKIEENSFENLTLAKTKPLHTFEYNNQKIETYLNYSIIDGERVSKQIYVKNEQVEVIEQSVNNDKSQLFIQNYNDKSYVIYLGKDGKIYSLKDSITYPKNFKNINIKSISTSLTKDTDNLLVEYKNGSYIAFNYRTGQIISEYKEKNVDFIDYVKEYLEISADKAKVTSTNNSYEEAKKLVSKLNKKSINQVLKKDDEGTNTPELYSRKYSIVYNPTTEKYDVYEIPTKSQNQKTLTKSLSTSVDSIIDSNPTLVKYYRGNDGKKINEISSILITIGVIIAIIISTIFVGRYYKKVRKARS